MGITLAYNNLRKSQLYSRLKTMANT